MYAASAHLEIGGDLYDYVALDDGRLAVVLGDVTGHGVDAAADMAMAKFVFRTLVREHPEPCDFLAAANDVVVGEIAPGKFITMLYLLVDPERGDVAIASAGHPPPRLVRPDGTVVGIEARGLALGVDEGMTYDEIDAELEPGGSVVLYTDGVIEARRGGELYGIPRLDALLARGTRLRARGDRARGDPDCRATTPAASSSTTAPSSSSSGTTDDRAVALAATRSSFLRGRGDPGNRDLRVAPARALLRLVDDRLGEHHRARRSLSLCLGYWLGGRIADRRPRLGCSDGSSSLAALLVALIPFVARPILDVAAEGSTSSRPAPSIGSFFATLLLFAPPVVAARDGRAVRDPPRDRRREDGGRGRRAAVRALDVGSLLGTFLPALVADPADRDAAHAAPRPLLLAAAAATLLGRRWLVVDRRDRSAARAAARGDQGGNGDALYEVESPYQFVQVVERGGARRLYLNEGVAVHSVWRPGTVLTGGVWDTFLAVPPLLGRPAAARCDPRQRGRDDRPCVRRLLAKRARSTVSRSTPR